MKSGYYECRVFKLETPAVEPREDRLRCALGVLLEHPVARAGMLDRDIIEERSLELANGGWVGRIKFRGEVKVREFEMRIEAY